MRLNLRFIAAIKFHSAPLNRLADIAGVNPARLAELIEFGKKVKQDDPCIAKVGELLGFRSQDCFVEDDLQSEDSNG